MLFCNQRHTASKNNVAGSPHSVNMRQMIEMVDWCRYLVDCEPASVLGIAHAERTHLAHEDYLLMMLDFSATGEFGTGVQAQIACGSYVRAEWSEATSFRRPADLQVVCEKGIAFIDLPSSLVWFDDAGQHMESLGSERPVGEQLLMHFHRQVNSLLLKSSSLEDAYRAMSIVIAAQQSYAEGRRMACGPVGQPPQRPPADHC
jgi:predicted dehydrogenase